MAIFISHTTKDDALAQQLYFRLKYVHRIDCYIDDLDTELAARIGRSSLTPLLVDRLRKCDTLLAVVTGNTKGSWWVPFEIGLAREMPRAISSYTRLPDRLRYAGSECLPEYLLEWPRLRSDNDIDVFAHEYKRKSLLLEKNTKIDNISRRSTSMETVRGFESAVMHSLGQRRF